MRVGDIEERKRPPLGVLEAAIDASPCPPCLSPGSDPTRSLTRSSLWPRSAPRAQTPPIELSPPRIPPLLAPARPCPSRQLRQQRSGALWASSSRRSWVQDPGADCLAWGDGAQVCRLRAKGCEGVEVARDPLTCDCPPQVAPPRCAFQFGLPSGGTRLLGRAR